MIRKQQNLAALKFAENEILKEIKSMDFGQLFFSNDLYNTWLDISW